MTVLTLPRDFGAFYLEVPVAEPSSTCRCCGNPEAGAVPCRYCGSLLREGLSAVNRTEPVLLIRTCRDESRQVVVGEAETRTRSAKFTVEQRFLEAEPDRVARVFERAIQEAFAKRSK